MPAHGVEPAFAQLRIRVQDQQPVAARRLAALPQLQAARMIGADDLAAGRIGDFQRCVVRTAVDDDHFLDQAFDHARHQRGQGPRQVVFGIEGGDDNGDQGMAFSHVRSGMSPPIVSRWEETWWS